MIVKEFGDSDRQKWNSFVLLNKGEFLQSWEWGDFQELTGIPSTSLGAGKIWRLAAVGDNGEILAVALIIRPELPLARNYLYCPRGPVFKSPKPNPPAGGQNPKLIELFLEKIREIARKEKSVFLRIEPTKETVILSEKNAIPGINLQPRNTLILNITKSEEQLLAEMKQKTRYNIKLAEKRGVKIRMSDKNTLKTDFEKFWFLTEETARRDKIKTHPKEYYREMLKVLPFAKMFLAEYGGEALAANIVFFFGSRVIYLHGASSSKSRNLMAPHLLQWKQIKNARESGFREYDFWGISSQTPNIKHQTPEKNWEGITRFKIGFGGKETNYPEAMDFVFQKELYRLIKFAKGLKKFFRPIQVF